MRPLPLLLIALAACADKADDSATLEDPAEHACEQRSQTGTALTAADAPEDAPALALGETPATASLVPGSPGYLSVDVTEEQAALLFAGTADVVVGLALDGVAQTLPQGSPNSTCPEDIPEHFDLDLDPGTWTITLGPAATDSVWLLLMPAEGHSDH